MPYFLDGNNLIGRARRTSRPTEEDRAALVGEIADRLRRSKAQAILFFDGAGSRSSTLGALSIRGCGDRSADDAILREIERSHAPQEIVLVTADRELSRRARDVGARTLLPEEFWRRMRPSSGPVDEASIDIEDWMRYFEDPRNRSGR